jgi:hypothetical protein
MSKYMNVYFSGSQNALLVNYCLSDSPLNNSCINFAIFFVMGLIAFAISVKKPNSNNSNPP